MNDHIKNKLMIELVKDYNNGDHSQALRKAKLVTFDDLQRHLTGNWGYPKAKADTMATFLKSSK